MAFDRAAARAAGYSEEEINAYLRSRTDQRGTEPVDLDNPPPPPPGNVQQPPQYGEMGTAALAAGGAALPFYAAYRYGLPVVEAVSDRLRSGVAPAAPAPTAPAPVQPVAPTAMSQPGAGARTIPIGTGAPAAPIAPTVAPAAAPAGLPAQMTAGMRAPVSAAPRIVDTATDMVRKLALEKLLPVARAASPVGAAASMLAPSPTGPRVPRSGPLRGSEINPATGAGWTEQELAQYEAAQRQRQPR